MKKLFIFLILGMLAFSGTAFAESGEVEITSPEHDDSTDSSITLIAESTEDTYCEYMLDHQHWRLMEVTGEELHTQYLSSLSPGEHKIKVHCNDGDSESDEHEEYEGDDECGEEDDDCANAMNDHVEFSVSASVPEFPTPVIPVLLSLASFGLISFKLK